MSNIFEKFREYQSRKVDNPNYEPLKQKILDKNDIMRIIDKEEIRKAKKREYNKKYNARRSEEKKARDRELRRKYYYEHKDDHKIPEKAQKAIRQRLRDPNEPTGLQIKVYNYMLEKYKETGNIPKTQQIARDFGKTDASIYSVLALLVKKGKLYKGARGQLYFTSHYEYDKPEMVYVEEDKYDEILKENESLKKKVQELEEVASKKSKKHVDGEDYSPGYVSQLKHSIKTGQKIISELKERVVYLEEKLEKVQVVEVNEENKSDYLKKLEDQNSKLADEVVMLRKIVKYLSRYID